MGRIRTIKPEFTQDEELSALPAETHLLAAGLLCYSDDDGYFNANHGLVKAAIFPLRESSVSIHDMLTQLANIGFIRLGTASDGKHYGQVVKFTEHQRVNRPTPSKIKGLAITWDNSVSTHGGLTEDSLPEGKGKEGKGRDISSNPDGFDQTLNELFDYYLERIGRNPNTYKFTVARKKKGLTHLKDCLGNTGGDLEKAKGLMKIAIDGLAASEWHMGRDPKTKGTRYCEWEKHLFESYEQMEGWWNRLPENGRESRTFEEHGLQAAGGVH